MRCFMRSMSLLIRNHSSVDCSRPAILKETTTIIENVMEDKLEMEGMSYPEKQS